MPKRRSAVARPRFVSDRAKNALLGELPWANHATGAGLGVPVGCGVSVLPETLEPRTHLSVVQDEQGWTIVTPEQDSRVIYVSKSAGDDDNGGRSPDAPVKSIRRGLSLIRNNSSDQLLLKRGDVWRESFGGWGKSGKSEQEPILIGAYGEGARPRLNTGNVEALNASGGENDRVDNVMIIGLHFSAHTRLPGPDFVSSAGNAGIRLLAPTDNFLIEDTYIEGYRDNIILQAYYGDLTDITIRRSVIVDAYGVGGVHAQGLFATGVKGLLLEENVFDHNGWHESVAGAGQTTFNHNVYLQADNEDVVVRGNIFANGSSHGLQARAGGIIENNLFIDNAIGMSFGLVNGSSAKAGGVSGAVRGNVFLGARTIKDSPRGWGLEIGNTRPDADTVISDNVFAGGGEDAHNPAIVLGVGSNVLNESKAVGINDLTIEKNVVYDWSDGIRFAGNLRPDGTGPASLNGIVVRDNDFQNLDGKAVLHDMAFVKDAESWSGNRYEAKPSFTIQNGWVSWDRWRKDRESSAKATNVKYVEPARDAGTYDAMLGGEGTTGAFVATARLQSTQTWRADYTGAAAAAYVRAGFAEQAAVAPTPPQPQEPAVPANEPVVPPAPPPPPPPPPPQPPVAAADVPAEVRVKVRAAALELGVTYTDDAGIDSATLDGGDLQLVGPEGFEQAAEVVSMRQEGTTTFVTYAVATPDGAWTRRNTGSYTLMAVAEQVKDTQGLMLAPAELASFDVRVTNKQPTPAKPDQPPVVKKLKLNRRDSSVTARFSEDVSGSVGAADLFLLAADGTRIDPGQVAVAYDPANHSATWTIPGLIDGTLEKGKYQFVLSAEGISNAAGLMLDGDRDGLAGGDFARPKRVRTG